MNQNQVCNEHKQPAMGVEINMNIQQDCRKMCQACLKQYIIKQSTSINDLGQFIFLDEFYQYMEEIKEEFKQNQAVKVNNINNTLNALKNEIQMIQTKVKQICDKLLENIHQILESSSQSFTKLDQQLKELMILSPMELANQLRIMEENFDYSKQNKLLKQMIDQFNINDQLSNCSNLINNEEINEDQILKIIQQKFHFKQDISQRTPHLTFTCEEHQIEIIHLDLSKENIKPDRLYCAKCKKDQQIQFTSVEDAFKRWEAYVKELHTVIEKVNQFYGNKQSSIILAFDKFISYLVENKSLLQEKFNQYIQVVIGQKIEQYNQQNQIKNYKILNKDEVIQICIKLSHQLTSQQIKQMLLDDFIEIDDEINNFLKDQILVPFIENIAKLVETLTNNVKPINEAKKQIPISKEQNQLNLQNEQITKRIQCQISNLKNEETQTLIQFELIMEIQEQEECWCMLFNKDETILVTCHDSKKIKIYELTEKDLKLLQVLDCQTQSLFSIQIHDITKQIITSDHDSINVWNYQQEQKQWIQGQILQGHNDSINCLISNQEENMLISGGDDQKINYWCKLEDNVLEWKFQGSINVHTSKILSLSLNEKQDFLISSEYNNCIVICKFQKNRKWSNCQVIKLDSISWRIAFIKDNLFVVQQQNGIFKTFIQQNQNQEFQLYQQINLSEQQECVYWFPLVYNKKNQLLLNKHHRSIYLMREENNKLTKDFTILFEEKNFWGTLSGSAKYLATWDMVSRMIQIRKLL